MATERMGRAREACGKMALALLFAVAVAPGAWAQEVAIGDRMAPRATDAKVWGAYARLVGHEWRGWRDVSVQWSDDGTAIVETWKRSIESGDRAGEWLQTIVIRADGAAGRLVATVDSYEDSHDGTYTGRVRGNGAVTFRMRGRLLQDNETLVEMESPDVAVYNGGWTSVEGMRAYAADSAVEVSPARWGTYAALAGRTWLISDAWGPMLVTVAWRVPGQLLSERIEWLDKGIGSVRETWMSSDGNGLRNKDTTGGAMHYGTVSADGSVAFHTKNLFALGQDWKAYLRDGKPRYLGMNGADVAYEEVGPDRIGVLMAEAARAREERAARERAEEREKSDRFSAALGAISGALSEAQEVASYNEAQSRASLDATLAEAARRAAEERAAAQTAQTPLAQASSDRSPPAVTAPVSPPLQGAATSGITIADREPAAVPVAPAPAEKPRQVFAYCTALKLAAFDQPGAKYFISAIAAVGDDLGIPTAPMAETYKAKTGGDTVADCIVDNDRARLERRRQSSIDDSNPGVERKLTDF